MIPPRPIRVIAAAAVGDVDDALQLLKNWGVKIPTDSRLHQARAILEQGARVGVLAPSHRGDSLGLRSLEIALDYSAIARTLPTEPLAAMRRELRDSLTGPIDPPEGELGPLQLQSQAVLRAAFVFAGESPIHPTHSPQRGLSSPDLILENGTMRYGIEAKRPQVEKNILPRFRDGCTQLANFRVSGGVLVDVSDCIRGLDNQAASEFVRSSGASLLDEVFEQGHGHKSRYGHIMLAGVYGRAAWSSDDGPEHAMVNVYHASRIGIFARAPNTLQDHRAKWIRRSVQVGFGRMTEALRPSSGNA